MQIENTKLYKYQIEPLTEINNIIDKLEEKTKENYKLKIGKYQEEYYNQQGEFILETGTILININEFTGETRNYNANFIFKESNYNTYENIDLNDLFSREIKVHLNNNIFENINKIIDKILQDNQEREKYYNKLENQLTAINSSLK